MNMKTISEKSLQVQNYTYHAQMFMIFVQKAENAYLQASDGPEDNTQESWFKKAVC
jgi:hypothetical protein